MKSPAVAPTRLSTPITTGVPETPGTLSISGAVEVASVNDALATASTKASSSGVWWDARSPGVAGPGGGNSEFAIRK